MHQARKMANQNAEMQASLDGATCQECSAINEQMACKWLLAPDSATH